VANVIYIQQLLTRRAPATRSMTLKLESRRKSRLRARLDDGTEVAVVLERGTVLRHGDKLAADDGSVVEVRAADELLSTAVTDDPLLLARAAYHLGNRHVPLQIDPGRLRFEHDHVLEDLVKSLGLEVSVESGPFEPEQGSYAGGHRHAHEDS
jgi:urease accessory protein